MKLIGRTGTSLEMGIEGYQFDLPDPGASPANLNFGDCQWLMVKGKIRMPKPGRSWEFLDPCLTTTELHRLAHWFKIISTDPTPRVITFVEPNLRFRFDRKPAGSTVQITLAHESASPWNRHTFPGFDELAFPTAHNDLAEAASDLAGLAAKFPPRSPPR